MAKKYNCIRNGKPYFKKTKTIGHKTDGTPIKKVFYGDGEKDCDKKIAEFMSDIEKGIRIDSDKAIIGNLMHYWLFDVKLVSGKVKPSTFSRYEGIYRNYIKDSIIASKNIKEIHSSNIQTFYNNLYYKQGFRSTQIISINKVLKSFFEFCKQEDYILKNPCQKIEIPSDEYIADKPKEELEILTKDQVKKLREYFQGTSFYLLFILAISTGLRQGEILALTWDDIDLKNRTISVNKTYKKVYEFSSDGSKYLVDKIQAPKTKNSYRLVPISDELYSLLNRVFVKKGYVFKDEAGNILSAKIVYYEWTKALKLCEIPHIKFHALRHTFASSLVSTGVDIKTLSELLGHSSITTTQIYLHSSIDLKQDAIKNIDLLFS